jgi:triacylglycerol esterase/lipase EstA (alpha/beta hydrolase family)
MNFRNYFIILFLFFALNICLFAQQDTNLYLVQADTTALGNRTPIFLIHGWNYQGKPAVPTPEVWNNFRTYFQSKDSLKNNFKLYIVCYWANSVSDSILAKVLRNKIDSINIINPSFLQKKIILMGHSMGGLISRSMMKHYKFNHGNYTGQYCGERVLRLITLGTPHHGSPLANGPARDAHVAPARLVMLQFFENTILANVKYNEVNRADIRWDNYDNLLDYNTYPNEKNIWLLDTMNGNTLYDNKIIIYTAKYTYTTPSPPYNENQVFDIGGSILKLDFGLDNDGIVPVKSSDFDLHTPLKEYLFNNYNHMEIVKGKNANDTVLFNSIKNDLLLSLNTGLHFVNNNLPGDFMLYQNFPNPFNPYTNIRYKIRDDSFVKLIVTDVLGKEVVTLVYEKQTPGTYEVTFDGSNLASGIYFYQLLIDNVRIANKKMVLIK